MSIKHLEKGVDFYDLDSHSKGIAIIRTVSGGVGITLSLEDNGDIEVFMNISECKELIEALNSVVFVVEHENNEGENEEKNRRG